MYILLGLIGLPIFTEGGGLGYIFKPTFGYIIGFCIASYVTGKIANKVFNPTCKRILAVNFLDRILMMKGKLYYEYIE